MSAAVTFQRLREEFERGWVELDGKRFTVHIFTPSSSEDLQFDRKTDKLIGSVHLPYSANTDDRENFTNFPGYVVVKPAPSFTAAADASRFASLVEQFRRLCNEAGAALQGVIRERLAGYVSWECDSPASWWYALLAKMTDKTVYHSDGTYNDHNIITGPWALSIRLIDHFGLNTTSPTWPEAEPKSGEQAKSSQPDWLHDESDAPPDTHRFGPVTGTQARIGFSLRRPSDPAVSETQLRAHLALKAKAQRPIVWVKRRIGSKSIDAFFTSVDAQNNAQQRVNDYSNRKPAKVSVTKHNSTQPAPRRKSK